MMASSLSRIWALHGALVQVVVAQQVQHGVYRQIGQLPAVGVAVFFRLRLHALQRDDHVPRGT